MTTYQITHIDQVHLALDALIAYWQANADKTGLKGEATIHLAQALTHLRDAIAHLHYSERIQRREINQ